MNSVPAPQQEEGAAPQRRTPFRFRLLRYFTIAGLSSFLVIGAVLSFLQAREVAFFADVQRSQAAFLREVQANLSAKTEQTARASLVATQQEANVNLTKLIANMLWDSDFAPFAARVQTLRTGDCRAAVRRDCETELGARIRALPGFAALDRRTAAAMQDSSVFKIKVYDMRGLTIYSSEHAQIGEGKADNAGWRSAAAGKAASELTHRDQFSAFEGLVENRDLLSSYIPLRRPGGKEVVGVFEIYADVTPFLRQVTSSSAQIAGIVAANQEKIEQSAKRDADQVAESSIEFLGIVVGVLAMLFLALLFIVRRGQGNIDAQFLAQEQSAEKERLWHRERMLNIAAVAAVQEDALCRLQRIASRVPGVVYELRRHPDGRSCVPYASDALREIYRIGPEDVREDASPLFAAVHPDDLAQHLASLDQSAAQLTPWHNEYRLSFAGEAPLWLLGNAIPQREADGSVLWHGFISDITARKLAQAELDQHRHHLEELVFSRTAELAQARDAAEAANRAKSVFLTNMSHELYTPMNAIMGMTGLALRRATDSRQIDHLGKSMAAAQHLLAVIDDVLDISRIEADRMTLAERNFSLPEVIDEVLRMLEAAAQAKGLRLAREIDPALPAVLRGDALRLRQVLLNYVGNAVKFSDHGEIRVRADAIEQDSLSVLLRIEVSDQGIGLSAAQQERLFSAFSQVDDSSTRKYGGIGLGLAISKRIARLMGGDAGVVSEEGVGSRFWATARLRRGVEEAGLVAEDLPAREMLVQAFAGTRVLVVDDDLVSREVAVFLLEDAGLAADVAGNGAAAVELASQADYALILMDMQLPVMDGLEASRAIRQLSGLAAIPILAMSADASDEDRQRCLKAGMDDHVGKPLKPEMFYASVLRWLQDAAAADPSRRAGPLGP